MGFAVPEKNNKLTTVAVTGAAGGLGASVVKALFDSDIKVRALITKNDYREKIVPYCTEIIVGSVENKADCEMVVRGADAVINCASLLPTSLHLGIDAFISVNVTGALNVFEAASDAGLSKAVFLSTIGVVDHTEKIGISDLFNYRTNNLDAYSQSKIELEKKLISKMKTSNMDVVLIRPGFIYGPNSLTMWMPILDQIKQGNFKILGNGSGLFPIVFEEDLAHYLIDNLKEEKMANVDGVAITSGPYDVSSHKVFSTLGGFLGNKKISSIPVAIAFAVALFTDLLPRHLRVGPLSLLSKRRVKEYSKGYDLREVLRVNNFDFHTITPMHVGFEKMIQEYKRK